VTPAPSPFFRGRVGVGVRGLSTRTTLVARDPLPNPPLFKGRGFPPQLRTFT
jgi:hypothetical protein